MNKGLNLGIASVSRRGFLRTAGLGAAGMAAACAPAAAPPAAAPAGEQEKKADWSVEWERLVAAAKQEGEVTVATYSGAGYRGIMDAFEAAYPGIRVQHSTFQSSSRDYVPRLLQELKAGLYLWDLAFMPNVEMLRQVRTAGGLEPIRPLFLRPDVLEDKNWFDGFDGGWRDNDKQWGYALTASRGQVVWVNTDMVKEGEIKSVNDLLNPKWKGKIFAADPRNKGSAFWPATVMRIKTKSDEIITKFFKDQEVVLNRDARQLTEFMVRGQYPVSFGAITETILADFHAQNLGKNLKPVPLGDVDWLASGSSMAWRLKNAPHPNAAKVFANWIASKDGGMAWSKGVQTNSRRADVPMFDEATSPAKAQDLVRVDMEDLIDEIEKTQKIAKEVLGA